MFQELLIRSELLIKLFLRTPFGITFNLFTKKSGLFEPTGKFWFKFEPMINSYTLCYRLLFFIKLRLKYFICMSRYLQVLI